MIKTIVLDLDDTLYPEHQYVLSGLRAVDQYLSNEKSVNGFYPKAEKLFISGSRGSIFNLVLDDIGFRYTKDFIINLVEVYRSHSPEISLFPDAVELLNRYCGTYNLGMITDGYSVAQWKKITALEINNYFQEIVVTDDLGRECWKPSLVPFQLLEERMDLMPEQCLYIGDNPTKDFYAPKKLGWHTIKLQREFGEYAGLAVDADYDAAWKVLSLNDVDKIVSSI